MKNNNYKWMLVILVIIVIASILIFTNNNSGEKIKIGVIMPLTGPAASVTDDLQKSIKMYGEQAKNIQFVVQDDQCTGKGALSAYNILKNQGVKVYIAACSGSLLALAPVAKADGNVIMTGFGGSIEIRKTGDEVMRFIPDGLSISEELVNIVKENPTKKYVLMHEKQDYSQSAGDYLMKEVGGQIVSRITYTPDAVSYRSELLKMKDAQFDELIFIPVSDPAVNVILKEMTELGINKKILGDVNVCDKLSLLSGFSSVHGQCLKTVLKTDGYNKYVSDFKTKFGHEPTYPFYNAITFDVLHFIDTSLSGVKNIDGNEVKILKDKAFAGIDGLVTNYQFNTGEDGVSKRGDVIPKKDYLERFNF